MKKHVWKPPFLLGIVLVVFGISCQPEKDYQQAANDPALLHKTVKNLTDVIVHDIFSPPVASRIYAYSTIAAYEAAVPMSKDYLSLAGQVNELTALPAAPEQEVCYPLASLQAFAKVGTALIFSTERMDTTLQKIHAEYKAMGVPKAVFNRSIAYGDAVAKHILEWAAKDKYKETRSYPKYSINTKVPGKWQPTPPAYMDAIEPSWNKIRPFTLKSADQFAPPPPTTFDTTANSLFMKETKEVYDALVAPDSLERLEIAKFWDCNPYVMHQTGHVMFATKKITPGGHWVNIAALACMQEKMDWMESVKIYAITCTALADGFISCWDEKYRSMLIRPESVINKYIDPAWKPLLQTPPFPEYTSGHSVISRAAATALTSIFGADFAFNDVSEEEFGLPARQFTSFFQASEEAAISRLYGGIHYKPAIYNGMAQGERVGNHVVGKLIFHDPVSMNK